jgi:hypothetical protein
MFTLKVAFEMVVALTSSEPQTFEVRPTAVEFWPRSFSLTRYPTIEPLPTFQVPFTEVVEDPAVVVVALDVGSESFEGGGPSMKWM